MIKAKIVSILSHDNVHIVRFDASGDILTMMSLELSEKVKLGASVLLQVKSSHVAIGKGMDDTKMSYSNVIKSRITSLNKGELFCVLKLTTNSDTSLEALITASSCDRLGLNVDDDVTAYIKASEISIAKVF